MFFGTFPLKLRFHNIIGPRNKKSVPLDMMLIYIFYLDAQETSVFETSKQPKKSAAEGGRLLRLLFRLLCRCCLGIHITKCRLASYLMEHIYFEAQLCSEIATLKEKSKKAKEQTITFGGWSGVCCPPIHPFAHARVLLATHGGIY